MEVKILEIRDRGTFMPMMAIKLKAKNHEQEWLLERSGYPPDFHYVLLMDVAGGAGTMKCDPYQWNSRTRKIAHLNIIENWDSLSDGDVIDVEFILEETSEKKRSERLTSIY